jgi:hypothetical protein
VVAEANQSLILQRSGPKSSIIESHAQDFAAISLRLDTTISAALPFHGKS